MIIMNNSRKWTFADYAFTLTGVIVGLILLLPNWLDITIENEIFARLRWMSPFMFLVTASVVMIKDTVDAKKGIIVPGKLFTYEFEDLLEDAIYMSITTVMVLYAVFTESMYISWLAGPITWIVYVFLLPLLRQDDESGTAKAQLPVFLLSFFAAGIVIELLTGQWIAFPFMWVLICVYKAYGFIRGGEYSMNVLYNILYYVFSVVLIAVGLVWGFWVTSWLALPVSMVICWGVDRWRKRRAM